MMRGFHTGGKEKLKHIYPHHRFRIRIQELLVLTDLKDLIRPVEGGEKRREEIRAIGQKKRGEERRNKGEERRLKRRNKGEERKLKRRNKEGGGGRKKRSKKIQKRRP